MDTERILLEIRRDEKLLESVRERLERNKRRVLDSTRFCPVCGCDILATRNLLDDPLD